MVRRKSRKGKLERRLKNATEIYDYCVENGVSTHKASMAIGVSDCCFYNTVQDWESGAVSSEQEDNAKTIIEMLLFVNNSFTKHAKILRWSDIKTPSPQQSLFSEPQEPKKGLVEKTAVEAAMFLTGKTRRELSEEALHKHCRELIQEYMANL